MKSMINEDDVVLPSFLFEASSPYFVYLEDSGSGESSYAWYQSPSQLVCSVDLLLADWGLGNGFCGEENALWNIVEKHYPLDKLSSDLFFSIQEYVCNYSTIELVAWGGFDDLCNKNNYFCEKIRSEFRQASFELDDNEDAEEQLISVNRLKKAIESDEMESFIDYLNS